MLSLWEQELLALGLGHKAGFLCSAWRQFIEVCKGRADEARVLHSVSSLSLTPGHPPGGHSEVPPRPHAGSPAQLVAPAHGTACVWPGAARKAAGDRLAGLASLSAGKGRADIVICLVTGEPHGKKMRKPSA